ncbi:hypothetical protein AAKU55_000676 [Oxalobacteraceae bacterium GrIS 1.11]
MRARNAPLAPELSMAIGLVWGHLNAGQFESAYSLGQVCLRIWPQERRLALMRAYAQVELDGEADGQTQEVLQGSDCPDWLAIVARRAGQQTEFKENHVK